MWNDVAKLATESKEEQTIKTEDNSTSFTVDQSREEVIDSITNLPGRWPEEIDGSTDKLGAEFQCRYRDTHQAKRQLRPRNWPSGGSRSVKEFLAQRRG